MLALVFSVTAVSPFGQERPSDEMPGEDREVLSAALRLWKLESTSALVDTTMTICGTERGLLCLKRDVVMSSRAALDFLDAGSLRERFLASNERAHPIGALTPEPRRAARERITPMFAPGGLQWSAVQRSFAGIRTLTQVSAPGVNADGNQALVYVETLCSPRCGRGGLVLMDKKADQWGNARVIRSWTE